VDIQLLAFASVSDVLGTRQLTMSLPTGTSIQQLKSRLEQDHPDLRPMWEGLAVAVNGELASDEVSLKDGDEVALLPPVSGGAGPERLVEEPLSASNVLDRVRGPGSGAVVVFFGDVRDNFGGRPVQSITYSAYRLMAHDRLARIEAELEEEFECSSVAIVHRLGHLEVGESSVIIGVSAPHREMAYTASRRALERLKAEVPIWKKEHYADGEESWREEEALAAPSGG